MSRPLTFHPLADLFPLVDGAEFDQLVADIAANGLLEPIVLFEGRILDGRNRYRACEAADVPCEFRLFDGDDPAAFVVSLNLRRRHLSESQRAMVAAKLANMRQGARTDLEHSANLHEVSSSEAAATTSFTPSTSTSNSSSAIAASFRASRARFLSMPCSARVGAVGF